MPPHIVKSGYIIKQGKVRKNWLKRWWELTFDEDESKYIMSYYEQKGGKMKGSFALSANDVLGIDEDQLTMSIATPERKWMLRFLDDSNGGAIGGGGSDNNSGTDARLSAAKNSLVEWQKVLSVSLQQLVEMEPDWNSPRRVKLKNAADEPNAAAAVSQRRALMDKITQLTSSSGRSLIKFGAGVKSLFPDIRLGRATPSPSAFIHPDLYSQFIQVLLDSKSKEAKEARREVKEFVDSLSLEDVGGDESKKQSIITRFHEVIQSIGSYLAISSSFSFIEDVDTLYDFIEIMVCSKAYAIMSQLIRLDAEEAKLKKKIVRLQLRTLDASAFEVTMKAKKDESDEEKEERRKRVARQHFFAQRELWSLNAMCSPKEKMSILLNAARYIYAALDESNVAASADTFMPHLIYIIYVANPPFLISSLKFIEEFRRPQALDGEEGYYLTSFLFAVEYLKKEEFKMSTDAATETETNTEMDEKKVLAVEQEQEQEEDVMVVSLRLLHLSSPPVPVEQDWEAVEVRADDEYQV